MPVAEYPGLSPKWEELFNPLDDAIAKQKLIVLGLFNQVVKFKDDPSKTIVPDSARKKTSKSASSSKPAGAAPSSSSSSESEDEKSLLDDFYAAQDRLNRLLMTKRSILKTMAIIERTPLTPAGHPPFPSNSSGSYAPQTGVKSAIELKDSDEVDTKFEEQQSKES